MQKRQQKTVRRPKPLTCYPLLPRCTSSILTCLLCSDNGSVDPTSSLPATMDKRMTVPCFLLAHATTRCVALTASATTDRFEFWIYGLFRRFVSPGFALKSRFCRIELLKAFTFCFVGHLAPCARLFFCHSYFLGRPCHHHGKCRRSSPTIQQQQQHSIKRRLNTYY